MLARRRTGSTFATCTLPQLNRQTLGSSMLEMTQRIMQSGVAAATVLSVVISGCQSHYYQKTLIENATESNSVEVVLT